MPPPAPANPFTTASDILKQYSSEPLKTSVRFSRSKEFLNYSWKKWFEGSRTFNTTILLQSTVTWEVDERNELWSRGTSEERRELVKASANPSEAKLHWARLTKLNRGHTGFEHRYGERELHEMKQASQKNCEALNLNLSTLTWSWNMLPLLPRVLKLITPLAAPPNLYATPYELTDRAETNFAGF